MSDCTVEFHSTTGRSKTTASVTYSVDMLQYCAAKQQLTGIGVSTKLGIWVPFILTKDRSQILLDGCIHFPPLLKKVLFQMSPLQMPLHESNANRYRCSDERP